MNQKEHIIQLDWDGPYSLPQLNQLMDAEKDYGVYQIYGKNLVYGSDVLLYIGKADQQTFGVRVSQEGWLYQNDANNIKIYVGRLHGIQLLSESILSKEIDIAERLLLYVHNPSNNSRSIFSSLVDAELKNVHLLNLCHHRDLLTEVSGARWTSKLDNVEYEAYRWSEKCSRE